MACLFADADDLLNEIDLEVNGLPGVLISQDAALPVDVEFSPLPGDVLYLTRLLVVECGRVTPEVLPQDVRVLAIYFALLHERELGAHSVARELDDLLVAGVLKVEELVGREGD